MMSSRGMPWSRARSTIRFATANRTSGSSQMPVSSLLIATTAAPYFLTSGRTRSSRSSSPVTRVDERLALVDGEAGLERLDDRASRSTAGRPSATGRAGSSGRGSPARRRAGSRR